LDGSTIEREAMAGTIRHHELTVDQFGGLDEERLEPVDMFD